MFDKVRERIRLKVLETVHGGDLRLEGYSEPAGDPGLFGPDSVVWDVHAHPAGMLTGGFSALMLQSLHPLAMAGVAEHSDYKADPLGRLNRTARYVTVTAFGSTADAEAQIAKVRRVHTFIHGVAPDGTPYSAEDPTLLTWVHVAEIRCFLAGYLAFGDRRLSPAERDRYVAETALLARRLGALEVPTSMAELDAYLARMRPQLRPTPAAVEAVGFLRGFGRDPAERAATRILMNGGISVLPGWARAQLGIRRPAPVRHLIDRPAVRLLSAVLVWACGPSEVAAAARARAARPADAKALDTRVGGATSSSA
ncbi:oxygenase MpaB family protein [Actinospica robiniae]|uniref:oxygenase MpaB family protein n=1 Tax=Actinospica robiniae TaxID=304901 RepID=UPI0003FF2342|nr:oxygenase MpaB family protein [Actinospica robiniae]